VRLAVPTLLLLTLFTTAGAWSADSPSIRVEAMVGEAVVVFEDIDCPDDMVLVPTGEVALAQPSTCQTIVALSTVSDRVSAVVWAIAAADPDDPEAAAAIKTQLTGLTTAEQALVIAVLHNNAAHLGTNAATVIATIGAIVAVNPSAAATIVLTASVLDPANAAAIISAASAPGQAEKVNNAAKTAEEIRKEFEHNQQSQPGAEEYTGGGEVEVISITEEEPLPPPAPPAPPTVNPPINNNVPPGGAVPRPPPQSPE